MSTDTRRFSASTYLKGAWGRGWGAHSCECEKSGHEAASRGAGAAKMAVSARTHAVEPSISMLEADLSRVESWSAPTTVGSVGSDTSTARMPL
eukprot:1883533-Prymnesium_polylepis.1